MLKFAASFLLAIAAGAGGPANAQSSQEQTAAALLARHRAFVGWQFGDGTFTSMRIVGAGYDDTGRRTEKIFKLSKGLLFHSVYTTIARGISERTGFTGNVFWQSDRNGFTTPIYGGYAKFLASLTVLGQEGTTELPASFVRNATIDGKAVGIVRVTLANGDPIDCYVDPQTGAYVRATIDPGGPYEQTIEIVSYAEAAPGKKMISSFRFVGNRTLYRYEQFDPNVIISDRDLHPPSPSAWWSFRNGDPIPIVLTKNRILVDALVNGARGRFILDTGATAIVLDDQFADRARVQLTGGNGEAGTFYGKVKVRTRRADTIDFGAATLHDVLVDSEDFRARDFRGLDREGYDGLIGYDFFAGAIVKLDVYGSKVTIMDPSSDLDASRGLPLLLDLSRRIPAIPITINRSLVAEALLDTGNPGVAFLSYDLAKTHDLRIGSPVCGNLESLTLGPIVYSGQSVCLDNFGGDMLLGYDFLKHFDYVFDFPHGRMFLTPNKN
ncbi:MAG: aspartyl protease family protein [Candidatus Eremiobacteraeota bacterium]|nr:aspartyl protease family protein [Candidatus Eremiobacteraeota bacterium]